jgi:hypothetical protein
LAEDSFLKDDFFLTMGQEQSSTFDGGDSNHSIPVVSHSAAVTEVHFLGILVEKSTLLSSIYLYRRFSADYLTCFTQVQANREKSAGDLPEVLPKPKVVPDAPKPHATFSEV